MEPWQLAMLFKPLGLLILFVGILLPLKWLFHKIIPEGRLKRLLFFSWKV